MSKSTSTRAQTLRKLASAAFVGLGLIGWTGAAASARPGQYAFETRNGADRIFGFVYYGDASTAPGSCEGRKGGAILAGSDDSAHVNGRCRF